MTVSRMRLPLAALCVILAIRAPALHSADCNGNGAEDAIDVATGSSPDCNANLVPDECDVLPVSYGLELDRFVPMDQRPNSVLARDLDGDGRPDLVVTYGSVTDLTLLWNDGAGGLGETRNSKPGTS